MKNQCPMDKIFIVGLILPARKKRIYIHNEIFLLLRITCSRNCVALTNSVHP